MTEFLFSHVRLMVAVGWNNAAVSTSCLVYHLVDNIRVFVRKFSDHLTKNDIGAEYY